MTPLLAQIRRGDRAFERLYRRRVADVYRYALAVLRDPAQAQEVTQRTFVDAYRAFARGDRPRNVGAWLLGLAHAACRERARADPDDEDEALGAPDHAPTPAEIRRALVHLPFNQRAALAMRELERRSYAEIAEVLALAPADVETLVFEARRALREHFEGALTCHQAERAISRSLDGRLARSERKPLKRHLSECAECARFAQSQRAQRSAWKVLANVPLPTSLRSFFGPGGVMVTTLGKGAATAAVGMAATTLAVVAIAAGGVGALYEGVTRSAPSAFTPAPVRRSPQAAEPAPAVVARARSHSTRARHAPERAAPRAARPVAVPPRRTRSRPRAAKDVVMPEAFQVRARPRPQPAGPVQTAAASPPAHRPAAPPAPAEATAPPPAQIPTQTLPAGLPQLPPVPPLPVPLPPPPLP
ncbi:MAG: sigma-70 family RNA polymerase sigma factor [Gaiellaceae bacterium]